MSRTQTLNTIHKTATYSDSDILDAMDEAREILRSSALKVWPEDRYMREIVKSVVREYEYVFRGVLGNG